MFGTGKGRKSGARERLRLKSSLAFKRASSQDERSELTGRTWHISQANPLPGCSICLAQALQSRVARGKHDSRKQAQRGDDVLHCLAPLRYSPFARKGAVKLPMSVVLGSTCQWERLLKATVFPSIPDREANSTRAVQEVKLSRTDELSL